MTFTTPLALLLLPLLAIPLARELLARRPSPALVVADIEPLRAAARRTWRVRLRRAPLLLRTLAIALVVIALARPREGLAITALPQEGIDVVVTVDVSSSMTTQIAANATRLSAAQVVINHFVGSLEGDRVGLVVFESRALTLSPLSSDIGTIRARVATLAPGLLLDGTAIGLGLSEAVALLEHSPAQNRVAILLTDGQNNAGEIDPLQAARVAQALGVRVYTIGFLGAGGDGVDRQLLKTMAESTGGRSYDARTQTELAAAYREIGSLERSLLGARHFTTFREVAPWLAGAALLLLTVEGVLRATWLRSHP